MNDRHQIAPYPIRMPPELREKLEQAAKEGARSLHAEIIARLERSLSANASGADAGLNELFAKLARIEKLVRER